MALAADRASNEERGEVLGTFTAFFDLGAATGGYLVGAIADRVGFGWAWATPGILCLVGLAVLARLRVTVRAEDDATRADETAWPEPAGT
jgi:MFS family permease